MNKKIKKYWLGFILTVLTIPAYATDLMDVYNQALQSDPVYQAAISTRLSNRENLPQAIAGLLPNLSASANTADNNFSGTPTVPGSASTGNAPATGSSSFSSRGYSVTLSQPLFNFANWMLVRQASATAKEADATLAAATQALMIRVAQAYFNVLLAQNDLANAQAQKAVNARQLNQTQQRYSAGLDAITTVANAQASYDAAVAQEIAAENTLQDNQEALRQLTGQTYPKLEGFKIELPLISPQPNDVERWVTMAEQRNLTLLAARYSSEASRAQIKENFAGHLPTLSAVGTYNRETGGETSGANGTTVGLQVSVPLFTGGLVNSETRQAEDNFQTASANMENTHRQVVVTTRQQYNNVLAGISKVEADREAINSAQISLDSTEESFKAGTRTIVDVLLAVQVLYQAKANYAQDQYNYLLNTLELKQAAGTLNPGDLQGINAWLHEMPATSIKHVQQVKSSKHTTKAHQHKKKSNVTNENPPLQN